MMTKPADLVHAGLLLGSSQQIGTLLQKLQTDPKEPPLTGSQSRPPP
jgi:hypothetical protein